MARFDIYRNPIVPDRSHTPYVIEVQSDFLSAFNQRVCVPLVVDGSMPGQTERFNPGLCVESQTVRLHPLGMGVFMVGELRDRVGHGKASALQLETALDMLMRGY